MPKLYSPACYEACFINKGSRKATQMKGQTHSVGFMMKMITDRLSTLFGPKLDADLTATQCRVLMYLEACGGGPVSQKSIASHLGITHTTAKGVLKRLQEKDYVRTAHDGDDARLKNAYLTEKSARVKADMEQCVNEMHEQLLNGLSAQERAQLADMLDRMYANIT